jgi:thioredoxin-like negative regulator of GroEL
MDLSDKSKLSISIIVILVITLVILYVLHLVFNKNDNSVLECHCEVKPQEEEEQNVHPDNIENIEQFKDQKETESPKNKLCLYYADWCGFSRQFLPEWKKLKSAIVSSDLKGKIKVQEFECDQDKETCQKANVRGYPSVVLHKFDGSNMTDLSYEGPRETAAIMDFIRNSLNMRSA